MDRPDIYDIAWSQHLARSRRLYGSSSSSTPPTFTTSSETIGIPTPSSLISTTTITLTSGTYPDDYPYFWPLLFSYIYSCFLSFWNKYILPLIYSFLIPLFILWVPYKLFLNVYPQSQWPIAFYPAVQQARAIQSNWRRDWDLVLRRLRYNFLRETISRFLSRAKNWIREHFFLALIGGLLLWFIMKRMLFITENPNDIRGRGFKIPEYMAREKKEEGSNHVGQFQREEEDQRVKSMGARVVEMDFEEFTSISTSSTTATTTITTTISSPLSETMTSSTAAQVVSVPLISTSISEIVSSSTAIDEGGISARSHENDETHAQGQYQGCYDENGLACCRKCRQRHCCEVFGVERR